MTLTWTTNGRVWLALHDDQWAKIEHIETDQYPFYASIGWHASDKGELDLDACFWSADAKFKTLEEAQEWAAGKMGGENEH